MHGFTEFPEDVKRIFKRIIDKYSFIVLKQDKSQVIIKNDKVSIHINVEYDEAPTIWFFDNYEKEYFSYPLAAVVEFSNSGNKIHWQKMIQDFKSYRELVSAYLSYYADLILKCCDSVLKGNFSWKEEYKTIEGEQDRLIEKLRQLDYDHPIYQKFRNRDLSWEDDIRNGNF